MLNIKIPPHIKSIPGLNLKPLKNMQKRFRQGRILRDGKISYTKFLEMTKAWLSNMTIGM